jgi:hypothetical protein
LSGTLCLRIGFAGQIGDRSVHPQPLAAKIIPGYLEICGFIMVKQRHRQQMRRERHGDDRISVQHVVLPETYHGTDQQPTVLSFAHQ